jgi:hypothetical protein
MQFQDLWDILVGLKDSDKILTQKGRGIMRIGQRIMDAKTKTIYRVSTVEKGKAILIAEDESGEVLIVNDNSQRPND